jgi:hypothetical protein
VSWLPGRTLTQNQAVTAMTIAEAVAGHADDLADNGSTWWLHIDQWAAELGITGPNAVAEVAPPTLRAGRTLRRTPIRSRSVSSTARCVTIRRGLPIWTR